MKVLVMNLLAVIVAVALTGKMDAKTTSNDKLNMVVKTTIISSKDLLILTFLDYRDTPLLICSAEERKVKIMIDDNSPNTTASATINVYSLDGEDVLGPYNVAEGEDLTVYIDERVWDVETLTITQNAELTYWVTD